MHGKKLLPHKPHREHQQPPTKSTFLSAQPKDVMQETETAGGNIYVFTRIHFRYTNTRTKTTHTLSRQAGGQEGKQSPNVKIHLEPTRTSLNFKNASMTSSLEMDRKNSCLAKQRRAINIPRNSVTVQNPPGKQPRGRKRDYDNGIWSGSLRDSLVCLLFMAIA